MCVRGCQGLCSSFCQQLALYNETFDEAIKQVSVSCVERGGV